VIDIVCNLCGRDDWFIRYPATISEQQGPDVDTFRCTSPAYGYHAQIVQCRNCGHIYANPSWTTTELLDAYSNVEDELYLEERTARELTFRRHLEAMETIIGPANGRTLLDVGAYIGIFIEMAGQSGWEALGVEPSYWAVNEAQVKNLPVIEGTLYSSSLVGSKFDVITMWDVIEHLADPRADLTIAYERLVSGGYVVIHTMDIDSLMARIMGSRWPWLMDMHLQYFSQRTLSEMLRQSGFEVIWSGSQGRYLSLGYLATRLGGLNSTVGNIGKGLVEKLHISKHALLINLGDLFTIYARRPS
jgi:hypothetical protein